MYELAGQSCAAARRDSHSHPAICDPQGKAALKGAAIWSLAEIGGVGLSAVVGSGSGSACLPWTPKAKSLLHLLARLQCHRASRCGWSSGSSVSSENQEQGEISWCAGFLGASGSSCFLSADCAPNASDISARIQPQLPNMARLGPTFVQVGPELAKQSSGEHTAEIGQARAKSGQHRPQFVRFRAILAEFGRICSKFGQCWPNFDRCWTAFARPPSGQTWQTSAPIRRISVSCGFAGMREARRPEHPAAAEQLRWCGCPTVRRTTQKGYAVKHIVAKF